MTIEELKLLLLKSWTKETYSNRYNLFICNFSIYLSYNKYYGCNGGI